jgi:hypothetical protein
MDGSKIQLVTSVGADQVNLSFLAVALAMASESTLPHGRRNPFFYGADEHGLSRKCLARDSAAVKKIDRVNLNCCAARQARAACDCNITGSV